MKQQETSGAAVDRIAESAHEAVDTAHEQVKKVAASASDLAEGAGEKIGEKIEGAAMSVGRLLRVAARRIREPGRGRDKRISPRARLAERLERAGTYLQKQTAGQVRADVEKSVQTRPIQAVLLSLSAGYLLARSLRR